MGKRLNPLGFSEESDSKVDKIYLELCGRIAAGEYKPGEILSENSIAEQCNVSRTPVREALRRLQQDRWVSVIRGVGMQVAPIDLSEIRDIMEVQEVLESYAIKKACERAEEGDLTEMRDLLDKLSAAEHNDAFTMLDSEFHMVIWSLTENVILHDMLRDQQARYYRAWKYFLGATGKVDKDSLISTLSEIYRAVSEKDAASVHEAVHQHMEFHKKELSMF